MAPKIYTKTGDKGETGLVGGTRISKADERLETYGTVDELNSALGLARFSARKEGGVPGLEPILEEIQNMLFNVGGRLACTDEKMRALLPSVKMAHVENLEKAIDRMTDKLPVLTQFILPGGSEDASFLHWARTVCRRAEREVVRFSEKAPIEEILIIYLNRLSDFLFVAARYACHHRGQSETTWKKL